MDLRKNGWLGAVILGACAGAAWAQPDRIIDTGTGWTYYYGHDETEVNAQIAANQRPFSICRTGTNTFDTLYVTNSGSYAVTGTDLRRGYTTAANLNSYLTTNNMRILDLECYDNGGTINMDVLVVPNSGATDTNGWSWGTFSSYQAMIDWQAANDMRPIDIDSFMIGGTKYYSCVAVVNSGIQSQGWWWGLNITEAEVTNLLTTNGARLIDVDIQSVGTVSVPTVRYNVLAVSSNPGLGVWDGQMTSAQVADLYQNNGARLTALERYTTASGAVRYAGAAVNNLSGENERIRDLVMAGAPSGYRGFARRRIGGGLELNMNSAHGFEPASTMKIAIGAYAVDRMASGVSSMATLAYNEDNCSGNEGDCPDSSGNCSAGNTAIGTLMTRMLTVSDNNATNALENYYGRTNINNWLAGQGLGIEINHTLGCLCGQTPNEMSCADVTQLYENIFDDSLFSSSWQTQLKNRMFYYTGPTVANNGWLKGMIDQERAATDLTNAEYANFLDEFEFVFKDGGYSCDNVRSGGGAGWAKIPFRSTLSGNVVVYSQEYTFALLAESIAGSTQMNSVYPHFHRELIREPVRAALASWDSICDAPNVTGNPSNQSVTEGTQVTITATTAAGPVTSGYTRQWQRSTNGGSTWFSFPNVPGRISGTTTNTITISNVLESDEGLFRLYVTSNCGSDYSTSAQLTVNPACVGASITTQPTAEVVTSGEDAVFSVVAGGSSSGRTYLWQKAPSGGGIYTDLTGVIGYSGVNTATLTVVAAVDADEGLYRCRVTNSCGQANSVGALLTVEPACVGPSVTSQPVSQVVDAGGEAVFTLTVNGSATGRVYQWQKRNAFNVWGNVTNAAGQIGGATTRTLTFFEAAEENEGSYRCLINNDCGNATSSIVTLTVNPVAPPCGTSDFNGDGDFGTDQDIEAFFACLAGNCCPTCWEGGSDFNGDGDFGTDQDIESFFRVLGGGPC